MTFLHVGHQPFWRLSNFVTSREAIPNKAQVPQRRSFSNSKSWRLKSSRGSKGVKMSSWFKWQIYLGSIIIICIHIYIYITLLVVVYIYSRIIVKDNWSVIWTQCIIHIHFCWPNSLSVSRGLPGHPRLWLSCSKSCMDRCCFQIKQNNNKTHQWMEGKTPERKMFVVPWNHFN